MKQPFSLRHKETFVGAFILIAGTVFATLLVLTFMQRELFEDHYRLKTVFSMGIGINVGTAVTLSGLNVGTVEAIQLNEEGKFAVDMRIKKAYASRIRKNSVATIRRTNPAVGDKIVNISQGTPDSPVLPDGGTIRAEDPPELDEALSPLIKMAGDAQKITSDIGEGKGTLGGLLKERSTLDSLNRFLASGYKTLRHADRLIQSVHALSASVDTLVQVLPPMVKKVDSALTDISSLAKKGDTLVEMVSGMVEKTGPILGTGENVLTDAAGITQSLKRNWLIRRNLPAAPDELIYEETRK